MPKPWFENVAPELRDLQAEQYELERQNIERHRQEATELVKNLLTKDARILVLDLSQGITDPRSVDEKLMEILKRDQFGGDRSTHGEIFRHLLGFKPGDPRVHIWDVPTEGYKLPYPDAWPDMWFATGGPAMPSELDQDKQTQNTEWLQRAVDAMKALAKAKVPGVAVCLGHQLWEYSQGAKVGTRHPVREFGTKTLHATDIGKQLQLLYGVWSAAGTAEISSSHREAVITPPPPSTSLEVVAFNEYSDYQMAAHALVPGQTVLEAQAEDTLLLSTQNHPEIVPSLLEDLRGKRFEVIEKEGLSPANILFRDTPLMRRIFPNAIPIIGRRQARRK